MFSLFKQQGQDTVSPVVKMVKDAIATGNKGKLCEILRMLSVPATQLVMEKLDHVERHAVITALGG